MNTNPIEFFTTKKNGKHTINFSDGSICISCYYIDGIKHGECKSIDREGDIIIHTLYVMGVDMGVNPDTLSGKEKMILSLKYDVEWL